MQKNQLKSSTSTVSWFVLSSMRLYPPFQVIFPQSLHLQTAQLQHQKGEKMNLQRTSKEIEIRKLRKKQIICRFHVSFPSFISNDLQLCGLISFIFNQPQETLWNKKHRTVQGADLMSAY